MTVTVQVGNSDNKLSQAEWSQFVHRVNDAITDLADRIWFSGTSDNTRPWQNACWVFDIEADSEPRDELRDSLSTIGGEFHQDWTAWTEGGTEHI